MAGEGFSPLGLLLSAGAAAALFFGLKMRQGQAVPAPGGTPGQLPGNVPAVPGGQPGETIPGGTPSGTSPVPYLSQFQDVQVLVNGKSAGKYAYVKLGELMEIQVIFQYRGPNLPGALLACSFREILYPAGLFPEMPAAPQLGDEVWYQTVEPLNIPGSTDWAWHSLIRRWYAPVYLAQGDAIIEVQITFMGRTWKPSSTGPVVSFQR